MSTNHVPDALSLCNACEYRTASPNSPAGLCLVCEGEARVQRALTETEQRLLEALDEADQWVVWPEGLVACAGCFCVFLPGFDPHDVLRYGLAERGPHDCRCHSVLPLTN